MQVRYIIKETPFHHPFRISKAEKSVQAALVVELRHFNVTGYGEAPAISYYGISAEKMAEDLLAKKKLVEQFAFSDPERYWHYLHHLYPANPFLVCALDMAAWDIFGKIKRQPLYALWGLNPHDMPVTDYTIGLDTTDRMIEKMKERPWPIYKIKVGMEGDVEKVAALREHSDAVFRVDANEGWTLDEALEKIPKLQALGVELVEQPLHKSDENGMRALFEQSALPLIADESCVSEKDVQACKGLFHGINIKLTKCSGITPARRMIREARELGLKIMLGCMNESSLGTAAIAHLAPEVDFVDMDGPLLLNESGVAPAQFTDARYQFSNQPGLGLMPDYFNVMQE